jgi:hypothetical protein
MQARRQTEIQGGYDLDQLSQRARELGVHLVRVQEAGQLLWQLVRSPEGMQPVGPSSPNPADIAKQLDELSQADQSG